MIGIIFIAPHEAEESISEYREYLTGNQVEEIRDNCDSGRSIGLTIDYSAKKTVELVVIEP